MMFQKADSNIQFRLHLSSSIEEVYAMITTDDGRSRFWAEQTKQQNSVILFRFLGYEPVTCHVLEQQAPAIFSLDYFGCHTRFSLNRNSDGGTSLLLTCEVMDEALRWEMAAGWVSVLMALKAAVDYNVDLRNHHPDRTWEKGYADN